MRLAALVLSACLLSTSGAAAQTVSAAFQGSWKGTGSQSNQPGVEWTIALTLTDGARESVTGTITYPSLECGGDLILREAEPGRVELLERITFGSCVDRGVVTLTSSRGGLAFDWRGADGLTARGTLSRAQPANP
jgi:hypothetical protein